MVLFHFRVHIDNLNLDKLVGFIKSNACLLLLVKEMGDRLHIHSIITPLKTVSTFRQKFLKDFPMCKGNKCYSLEEVREEEDMKAYMCKGESEGKMPDVVFNKDVDVEKYHLKYWEVNKSLKTNTSSQKVKTMSWMMEVKTEFVKEYPVDVHILSNPIECMWKPTEQEKADYVTSQKKLLGFVLKKLGKSVKVIDDNIIARMYKGIQNSLIQDGNNTEKFVDFMFGKIGI